MFDTQNLATLLNSIAVQLGSLLEEIQTHHSYSAIALLLGFSFLYGLIHAAGPGHGKTLVASYYGGQDRSYKNALFLSLLIAIVHTFSAYIITYVLYFFFQHIISVAMIDVSNTATKLSGFLIFGIGLSLLLSKIKHYKATKTQYAWHTQKTSACTCASCKTDTSSDVFVVLAAGLVPCPGTITIFLFSITLNLNIIGFLCALTMSLGMGFIIAVTALLSTSIRRRSKNNYQSLLKYLDIGSTLIIMLLGLIIIQESLF